MSEQIGDYLRQLRGNRSLREISELTGKEISHNYVRDAERGVTGRGNKFKPSPDKLKVFAKVYEVPYDRLMRMAGYAENTPDWATEEDVVRVESILDEKSEMTIGGESLPPEKAKQVRNILRAALYEELEKQNKKGSR